MDNLRVAVCDDDTADLSEILSFLKVYDPDSQMTFFTFLSSKDLLKAFERESFDIVLLDIEMDNPNGLETAKILSAASQPPETIFVTKNNAYAMKGYGLAIRYLQKPLTTTLFTEAMDAAVADATAHRMTFQSDNSLISVRLREIQFIETFGHYIVVHTEYKSYRFRSTLREITDRLPKGYFVSPHKSYVVNLEHIRSASSNEITMDCGMKIPIGRKRMQEFNDAFYRFLGR